MWNNQNQFPSVIKVIRRTDSSKEASSTQVGDTFEFKRPYPPPLRKTYSRLRSLVDRPEKKSSPRIHRPSPGLHFLETFRHRQRAKLRKFQSFPSTSSNVGLLSPPSSLSESFLWSTSTTATVEDTPATSTLTSDSLPEFPPLRRSKAMSIPSRSFPIPSMTGLNNAGGVKRLLQTESTASEDDDESEGLYESSPCEGLEMEICHDFSSAEPSEDDSKAVSLKEFPIPTLISGRVSHPVFQPRSPPGPWVRNLDEEERNNNDTHDKEPQWSREQLDILVSAKDSFRFQQRNTVDLVFKELSALETGRPCSKMDIKGWLEKANVGLSFSACHVSLKLLTCDMIEAEGAPVRTSLKLGSVRKLKLRRSRLLGK